MLIKRIGKHTLPLPKRQTLGAAAYDLQASDNLVVGGGGEQALIPTGFAWSIPRGYVGIVKDRSGLAVKKEINTHAGVIDSDYRGEIKVLIRNNGYYPFEVKKGDRIAQMLIVKHESFDLIEVSELDETERSSGGFGSTGK